MYPSEAVGGEPVTVLRPLRPARRYQLPAAPSVLLGRDRDLDSARDLILGGQTRLLTLVGPPGVGKTRLALAIAEALQEDFEQGAAFVDLSPVRDSQLVLEAVAHAFGLRQQGTSKPASQLDAYLRDASLLLVLADRKSVV